MQIKRPRPELVFARRARELREIQGISQTELAKRLAEEQDLKIDSTSITRLEKGGRGVRLDEAAAIAAVLGQTIDQMLIPGPLDQLHALEATVAEQEAMLRILETTLPVNRRLLGELREQVGDDGAH